MAQVAPQSAEENAGIDTDLDRLVAVRLRVPEVARSWSGWDPEDRVTCYFEWSIPDDLLAHVEDLARCGRLSPEQQERLRVGQDLARRHRPTLDRLFAQERRPA